MQMPPDLRPSDFARIRPLQFAWLALACVAGTAFATTQPTPPSHLHGQLTIVGSSGLGDVVARWARIFRRKHPGVRVMLMPMGSGVAAGAMADGDADLAALTRCLRKQERLLSGSRPARPILAGFASSREPLYLYVNRLADGRPAAAAAEFVRVALSPEGQAQINGDRYASDPS